MEVRVLDYTSLPLQKIGECAGICYNTDTEDVDKNLKRARHCLSANHFRNLELAMVTLEITGISCRLGRELYTHLGGMPTRLQASTRYIDYRNFNYIIPKNASKEEEEILIKAMQSIQESYKQLKELGTDNDITGYLVPLAAETTIILQCNARMLMELMGNRLCSRALLEFRDLAKLIKFKLSILDKEWKEIADNLFVVKCKKHGYCPERNPCSNYKGAATNG